MTLTNKALRLKRSRELKDIFKDNKDIVKIEYYNTNDNKPFGHVIYIKNGLEFEYIQKLTDAGFEIVNILKKSVRIDNSEPIDIIEIQIWKHPVEKEECYFGENDSFKGWERTDFYNKSKEIGSQEYYRVKYELLLDKNSEQWHEHYEERSKVSKLESEIKQLKEENYKLLKEIVDKK